MFPPDAALPSHTRETLLAKEANAGIAARECRARGGPAADRLDLFFVTNRSGWRIRTYSLCRKIMSQSRCNVLFPSILPGSLRRQGVNVAQI